MSIAGRLKISNRKYTLRGQADLMNNSEFIMMALVMLLIITLALDTEVIMTYNNPHIHVPHF